LETSWKNQHASSSIKIYMIKITFHVEVGRAWFFRARVGLGLFRLEKFTK
jgi:hypothetical protein